jgi:hypothetical protein
LPSYGYHMSRKMTSSAESNKAEQPPGAGRPTTITRREILATGALATSIGLAGCPGGGLGGAAQSESEATVTVTSERFDGARRFRTDLGGQLPDGDLEHRTNGDEARYDGVVASFGKGLPHNDRGEPDPDAYRTLVDALNGDAAFADIPMGAGGKPLANPQAALDFATCGADPHQQATPPAPAFASEEMAGEVAELYWKALARDVPFREYRRSDLVADARAELMSLDGYAERTPTSDPAYLFTGNHPHAQQGPYISQFLYRDIPRGQHTVDQRFTQKVAGEEFLTDYDDWLAVQRGAKGLYGTANYRDTARYIVTGRDLATYVHRNAPYQSFLSAALILLGDGVPFDEGNPFVSEPTQNSFLDLGPITVLGEVGGVLQSVQRFNWYSKWMVHRRIRPEEFGGRVHNDLEDEASYPFADTLRESEAVRRVRDRFGTALLPQAYPEGGPTHPSYPAGHAGIAGACGGVVKAIFDTDSTLDTVVRPTATGRDLKSLDTTLSVEAELNKLQFNHYLGRNWAGIHYRSDGIDGHVLGERVAAAYLNAKVAAIDRGNIALTLPTVDGRELTIDGDLSRRYPMPDPESY